MSENLGQLIRERRLGLGLSLGQLATKAATSSSVVRSWERGESFPDEAAATVLGELLEIDRDEFEAAQLAAAVEMDETPTEAEPVASEVAPDSPIDPVGPAPGPDTPESPSLTSVEVDGGESFEQVAMALSPEPKDAGEPVAPMARDEPEAPPVAPTPFAPVPAAAAVLDPDAPRPVALRYPESAPAGVPVEIAETDPNVWNPLRYLYDPDRPWLYWIRAALTVVVLLILVNILFDSVGELFDKVGEVIDSVEPSDGTEPTTTDA